MPSSFKRRRPKRRKADAAIIPRPNHPVPRTTQDFKRKSQTDFGLLSGKVLYKLVDRLVIENGVVEA